MKKLTLSLLFSTALLINTTFLTNNNTSDKIIEDIRTYKDSPGIIIYGNLIAATAPDQTVTLGNTTGSITIASSNIINPTSGNNSLLMINNSGNIITGNTINSSFTCGPLETTAITSSGSLIAGNTILGTLNAGNSTLGNTTTDSLITTTATLGNTNTGSLTAAIAPGQTVILGNTTGSITIASSNIINPPSGNNSLLMINDSGNIITGNTINSSFTCGPLETTAITSSGSLIAGNTILGTLNAGSSTLGNTTTDSLITTTATLGNTNTGSLTAAIAPGQTVILGNTTGSITIASSNIINPTSGNNSLLMINDLGNIITGKTTNSSFSCGPLQASTINTSGSLNAGNTILGTLNAGSCNLGSIKTSNIIANGSTTINGNLTAGTNSYSQITLGCNTGLITFMGAFIKNAAIDDNSLLMINQYGNVWTGNTARGTPLTFGALTCDNFTAAAGDGQSVHLGNTNGTITISSNNIIKIATGATPLYINQYGAIKTLTSSKTYKENINKLETNNTFDLLEPVSFYYINDESKQLEYGFIAEKLADIPFLSNTVIYNHEGKIESLNYQGVFVALTADYLATKKKLNNELLEKDKLLYELQSTCKSLHNEIKIKNEEVNSLKNRCTLLEITIKQIISKLS
jgi:hypothetical protein